MEIKLGDKLELVKQWQKFLGVTVDGTFGARTAEATRFFQAQNGLRADGIVGKNTIAAAVKKGFQQAEASAKPSKILGKIEYTDDQILSRIETPGLVKGFNGWRKGIHDLWMRSALDIPDAFNDKVYTYECKKDDEHPIFISVCTGTSHAGVFYQQNFAQYNPDGVAVVLGDSYNFESHAFGYHNQKSNGKTHPAYRQAKPIYFTRDKDKDNQAENYGKIYYEHAGLNCHRAKLVDGNYVIGRHSAGCMVRNAINRYNAWLAFMNKRPLSVGVLNQWEV